MQVHLPENPAKLQQTAQAGPSRTLAARTLLTTSLLAFSMGTIGARVLFGPSMDGVLIVAFAIATSAIAFRSRFKAETGTPSDLELLQARRSSRASAASPTRQGLPVKAKPAVPLQEVSLPVGSQPLMSAESFRALDVYFDRLADGICGVDGAGRISFSNPAAERLLSAGSETLSRKLLHDTLHGFAPAERRCGEDCLLLHLAPFNQAATGEVDIFRADGSFFRAEYVFTPIIEQERFTCSVLSFRDISQRHALERLKDEFVATVSHELRSPLTSIRGALGLLSNGALGEVNEKAAHLLRIALTNSDRLARLINDILDLERIQRDREPIHFRKIQLAETVRQTIDGMMPVAEEAGVRLIFDGTQVEIEADADRLVQVLTNLLSNAIKFSDTGSAVSVLVRAGGEGVTLSVVDQGRGIPDGMLEVIFGRFQQVEAADSRQKGGSGLGLAICRAIVLQHEGRIWAERNPDGGSTFHVFLPYRPIAAESTFDLQNRESCFTAPTLL